MDQPGLSIGPYRLVASLGRGGQADVFLAVKRGIAGFSKLIVIKSIRHDLEHEPRFREALIAEARLAARLQHPNVVQTLEVGDHRGQVYLAMEFLDGQPLDRVAQRAGARLGVAHAAAIVSGMLAGPPTQSASRGVDPGRLVSLSACRDAAPARSGWSPRSRCA